MKRRDALVPDWPREAGDALALCLEIAVRNQYELAFVDWEWTFTQAGGTNIASSPITRDMLTETGTALALAQLALAALRAGA
jgi:hypothetical protein